MSNNHYVTEELFHQIDQVKTLILCCVKININMSLNMALFNFYVNFAENSFILNLVEMSLEVYSI